MSGSCIVIVAHRHHTPPTVRPIDGLIVNSPGKANLRPKMPTAVNVHRLAEQIESVIRASVLVRMPREHRPKNFV